MSTPGQPVLAVRRIFGTGTDRTRPPLPVRLISTAPWLRRVPAYFLAYGALRDQEPPEDVLPPEVVPPVEVPPDDVPA